MTTNERDQQMNADQREMVTEQPGIIAEVGMPSRGGYRDEEDYAESRKRSERVRGDFLAATFKAKATFSIESVTLNMACVKIFPSDQFASLTVDPYTQRVIVETCEEGESFSLKIANRKKDRNVPR